MWGAKVVLTRRLGWVETKTLLTAGLARGQVGGCAFELPKKARGPAQTPFREAVNKKATQKGHSERLVRHTGGRQYRACLLRNKRN